MSTSAQTFFLSATDQDDTWGTDIRKLLEAVPALDSTTICDHPNAAGTTDITVDPYSTTTTQSDIRSALGWAINQAGADGMGSSASAQRIIPAGVWTFTNRVTVPNAGTVTGSLTASLLITVYRVGASPGFTRTALFSATSNTVATSTALGTTGTLTATSASQPQITLAAGETIHVGYLSHMVQVAGAVGATVVGRGTYHTGTEGGVTIKVDIPSPGVRTLYPKSLADNAPATDALTRIALHPRALADSAPATDAITRAFTGARSLNDNAPATDILSRVAAHPRALADNAPSTDALIRTFIANRSLTDAAPATDALARRFTGSRSIADNAPASDLLARVAIYSRTLSDPLAAAAAAQTTYSRSRVVNN